MYFPFGMLDLPCRLGFSLVVASRGCSRRQGRAFPRAGSLGRAQASSGLLRTCAPRARGGTWAPQRRLVAVARGLSYSSARGVFPAGTRVCCTSRQLPHRWAPGEALCTGRYNTAWSQLLAARNITRSAVWRLSFLHPVTGKLLAA